MKTAIVAASVCLLLVGCAKRPPELKRAEKLDAECQGKGVAYSYSITNDGPVMERAVKKLCYAPLGAWTDENDANKGGTRKLVIDMRENEKTSFLCCKD
jgi:hypothetical protein